MVCSCLLKPSAMFFHKPPQRIESSRPGLHHRFNCRYTLSMEPGLTENPLRESTQRQSKRRTGSRRSAGDL